jgi:hypothetical protein
LGALLDEVMPNHDVHEVHSLWVPAGREAAYQAVLALSAREVRLFGPLMMLRTFGRSRRAFDPRAPLLGELLKVGFMPLGERPGEEIVVGAIGRFWSPFGNRPQRVEDFTDFDEPGFAKAALNFTVRPEGAGSRITTETRIASADPAATRKFRRYWLLIRLGSGAIRRSWLKAIRRRLVHAEGIEERAQDPVHEPDDDRGADVGPEPVDREVRRDPLGEGEHRDVEDEVEEPERDHDQRQRQDREDRFHDRVRDPEYRGAEEQRSPAVDRDAVEEPVDHDQGDDVDAPSDERPDNESLPHRGGV